MKNYLRKLVLATVLLSGLSLYADLSQPYASVHTMPQTPYYVQDGYIMYDLINKHSAAVIVDVESHDGGVARYIAQQVSNNNLPSVQRIFSVSGWTSADRAQKDLFQRFLSNVVQENTSELITAIRMPSQEGAKALNITADFISLVGGNDEKGIYQDILAWYPHLSDTGVMCGNNWNDASVQIGVTKAASALDLTVKLASTVWYFEKQ
jgi:Methyltransferase domain